MILSESEAIEAIREWCNRRFPVSEKTGVSWKAIPISGNAHRLEVTIEGVEIPPKEGPYR